MLRLLAYQLTALALGISLAVVYDFAGGTSIAVGILCGIVPTQAGFAAWMLRDLRG